MKRKEYRSTFSPRAHGLDIQRASLDRGAQQESERVVESSRTIHDWPADLVELTSFSLKFGGYGGEASFRTLMDSVWNTSLHTEVDIVERGHDLTLEWDEFSSHSRFETTSSIFDTLMLLQMRVTEQGVFSACAGANALVYSPVSETLQQYTFFRPRKGASRSGGGARIFEHSIQEAIVLDDGALVAYASSDPKSPGVLFRVLSSGEVQTLGSPLLECSSFASCDNGAFLMHVKESVTGNDLLWKLHANGTLQECVLPEGVRFDAITTASDGSILLSKKRAISPLLATCIRPNGGAIDVLYVGDYKMSSGSVYQLQDGTYVGYVPSSGTSDTYLVHYTPGGDVLKLRVPGGYIADRMHVFSDDQVLLSSGSYGLLRLRAPDVATSESTVSHSRRAF